MACIKLCSRCKVQSCRCDILKSLRRLRRRGTDAVAGVFNDTVTRAIHYGWIGAIDSEIERVKGGKSGK